MMQNATTQKGQNRAKRHNASKAKHLQSVALFWPNEAECNTKQGKPTLQSLA